MEAKRNKNSSDKEKKRQINKKMSVAEATML
jgi:hypothetical protein